MIFKPAILYVDDEPTNLEVFKRAFGGEYLVKTCLSAAEALQVLATDDFPLVIADQRMPQMTGIELCEKLVVSKPETIRMILTAYSEPEMLLSAINRGKVHDYIVKPWRKSELKPVIEKCFQIYKERGEKIAALKEQAQKAEVFEREVASTLEGVQLLGAEAGLKPVMDQLARVATTDSTVLLLGETGTGKELLARTLHQKSARSHAPFVPVHCGALASGVLESELFGHVKGAFTGADQNRTGCFELAQGGTLFLDEVGEIPEAVQVKLLRVLQERVIQRVGASQAVPVDFRLVAATHRDLQKEVKDGRFREDLFYRLHVVPLKVPSLRERVLDIPILAEHFLKYFNSKLLRQLLFSPEALKRLSSYDWPGNVRELQNVVERAVILSPGPQIEADDLNVNEDFTRVEKVDLKNWKAPSVREQIQAREMEELKTILEQSQGNIAEAARALGVARSTLFHRLKKHQLI